MRTIRRLVPGDTVELSDGCGRLAETVLRVETAAMALAAAVATGV